MALSSNLKDAQLQEQVRQLRIRRGELRLKPGVANKPEPDQTKDPSQPAPSKPPPSQD